MTKKEFITDDLPSNALSDAVKFSAPNTGLPSGLGQTPTQQLDSDQLDAMINNPNEHPEIRKQAMEMKMKYFSEKQERVVDEIEKPEPEEIVVEEKPKKKSKTRKPRQKKKPTKLKEVQSESNFDFSKMKTSLVDNSSFSKLINNVSGELYVQEVSLLSHPEISLKLRSMTVAEYKFLATQMEMFYSSLDDKKASSSNKRSLSESLDVILSRCITDPINVDDLSLFDWFYLLMYLRCISRGETSSFVTRRKKADKEKENKETIEVNLYELLDFLNDNKESFVRVPVHTEELNDVVLVLMPLTRGDVKFAERYTNVDDNEMGSGLANVAMSINGFVEDGEYKILEREQRIQLFNNLNYDVMSNLIRGYKAVDVLFNETINQYFEETHPEHEALRVSDFILSFYDI